MSSIFNSLRLVGAAALGFAISIAAADQAFAATPLGEWLVAEKSARIKLVDCAGSLWGIVSWEADPGLDSHNPDPKKRNQPITGTPVLLGLKPSGPNRWDGSLYNADNGKTYSGGITLVDENALRVRGCILFVLCGGENWKRVDAVSSSNTDMCKRVISEASR
ncbi:MAG TPA: DUF2147 domain-containing protein [Micropepsaceae bacterium]|jgi:uncharacterized protein (DUF2147 family)|nr:DUF2147 domain-containing protein [Micropepsaceae bacterium]